MENTQHLKIVIILLMVLSIISCGGRELSLGRSPSISSVFDKIPDPFTINDHYGALRSARVSLGSVVVRGIDEGVSVYASVKGGSLHVNGGLETTISAVSLGDSIEVFGVAGNSSGQNTSVTLTISGVSASAFITTSSYPSLMTSNEKN